MFLQSQFIIFNSAKSKKCRFLTIFIDVIEKTKKISRCCPFNDFISQGPCPPGQIAVAEANSGKKMFSKLTT